MDLKDMEFNISEKIELKENQSEFRKKLYERYAKYRDATGKKDADVSKLTRIGKSTFSDWKSGRSAPKSEKMSKIADVLGVSVDELLGNESENNPKTPRKIPVLGSVAAGIPLDAIEDVDDIEEIPASMTGEYFALRIKGTSMEPRMYEGDVVIVRRQPDIESGDVAVVQVNGDLATCKRVSKHMDGITLLGFNPQFEPITYSNDQIKKMPVIILGKVVECRQKY